MKIILRFWFPFIAFALFSNQLLAVTLNGNELDYDTFEYYRSLRNPGDFLDTKGIYQMQDENAKRVLRNNGVGPNGSKFEGPLFDVSDITEHATDPPTSALGRDGNSSYCEDCHMDGAGNTGIAYNPSEYTEIQSELDANEEALLADYLSKGGDAKAFDQVMCFFKAQHDKKFNSGNGNLINITEKCKIGINNFMKSSAEPRLFILNRCTGKVEKVTQSSNGQGKGDKQNGKGVGQYYSNEHESKLSPSGFFIMGEQHDTDKSWTPGRKMHGLQVGVNTMSYARGVVMHKVEDCDSTVGCYRTNGCLGIEQGAEWTETRDHLMGDSKGGPLMYNYSPREAQMPEGYCGDNLWQEVPM